MGEFVPGYEATTWYGVGAPKNTPIEIVSRLNREINAALADPAMKAKILELGVTLAPSRGIAHVNITRPGTFAGRRGLSPNPLRSRGAAGAASS
jgi:hypothetical protein